MLRFAAIALFALGCLAAADTKDPNEGVVTDPTKTEVWTTDKGAKYHTKDCTNAKIKETLAEAIVDKDTPCAKCSPPVYDPAKIVVFIVGEGKKYHLFNCRFVKDATQGKSTLAEAVAKGLEPCSVCKAPALWTPPKAADAPAKPVDAAPAKDAAPKK